MALLEARSLGRVAEAGLVAAAGGIVWNAVRNRSNNHRERNLQRMQDASSRDQAIPLRIVFLRKP